MKRKVLVALSTFGEHGEDPLKMLQKADFEIKFNKTGHRLNREEVVELGSDAEGIIAGLEPYDDHVLEKLNKLSCISRCGVGIDNISLEKAKQKGITILNTPEAVIQPVAELTVAMIFDLLRKLTLHTELMRAKKWERKTGYLLAGKTIGILGLGRIGKRVAEILLKLGTKVYAADVQPDKAWAAQNGVEVVAIDEVLSRCDILCLHLSVQGESPFCLGKKEIDKMKKGAMVVNVSRGQFIDEKALASALRNGHLSGAALDVFIEEPYHGELCALPNVVLTPHIASLTEEARLEMEIQATENLIKFFK